MKYKTMEELIDMIERPTKTFIFDLYKRFKPEFLKAQGSQHNHQAWEGGYIDHVVETMNIARLLYQVTNDKRRLPFTLSDTLIVLFLHDLEKAFPERLEAKEAQYFGSNFVRAQIKDEVRAELFTELGVYHIINETQLGGIRNVEGEKNEYTNHTRTMSPLAAFCHMCDIASARIWFDRPGGDLESWGWRTSAIQEEHPTWGV